MPRELITIIEDALRMRDVPFFVFIAGGSCSGKSTLARKIAEHFPRESLLLPMDDFYIGSREMKLKGIEGNYDHISAIDVIRLKKVLRSLKSGWHAVKPKYDFRTHDIVEYERVEPKPVVILEGLYALHHWVNEFGDLRVFLECKVETMRQRRLPRDSMERGSMDLSIGDYFDNVVIPMYVRYVLPTRRYADMVEHT